MSNEFMNYNMNSQGNTSQSNYPIQEVIQDHIEFNKETSQNWDLYTGHRNKVMQSILAYSPKQATTICILGAGNCNDIDLHLLVKRFQEVHLIDIDTKAILDGICRQNIKDSTQIIIHSEEFSGIYNKLAEWKQFNPSEKAIGNLLNELNVDNEPAISHYQKFDVVVSVCVQSQITHSINSTLLSSSGKYQLSLAARNSHLNLLLNLTDHGLVLFINDLVDLKTEFDVSDASDFDLDEVMMSFIKTQNFFTGNNPFAIREMFEQHKIIAPKVKSVDFISSWLWQLTSKKVYMVYGFAIIKI
ncbi:MAG: hypothetical protein JWP12_3224 [Bacteroidetes bacterium]|nr:hypothetical protein [Bacteroidota bacterium]